MLSRCRLTFTRFSTASSLAMIRCCSGKGGKEMENLSSASFGRVLWLTQCLVESSYAPDRHKDQRDQFRYLPVTEAAGRSTVR